MRKKRGRSIRVRSKGQPDFSLAPGFLELIARRIFEKISANADSNKDLGKKLNK